MSYKVGQLTALPFLFVCAGCATMEGQRTTQAPVLQFNPIDSPQGRPDIFLTGGLSGKLTRQGACIIVTTSTGKVVPLWPIGTTLKSSERGLAVELPDSRGTAYLGERVRLSGSTYPSENANRLPDSSVPSCPNTYFAVSGIDR